MTRRRALLAGLLVAAALAAFALRAGRQGGDSSRDTPDRRGSYATDVRGNPEDPPQETALLQLLVVDREGRPIPRATVRGQRTNEAGRCLLELEPNREYVLDVRHASYGAAQIRLEPLSPTARVERVVRLYPGLPLEVRVLHPESGVAIQGAHVELRSGWWVPDAHPARIAVTDQTGTARWQHVPAGYASVEVVPPGFAGDSAYFEVRSDNVPPKIVLEAVRVTRVVVRVVNEAGEPVTKVERLARETWTRLDPERFETFLAPDESRALQLYGPDRRYGSLTVRGDGSPEQRHDLVVRRIPPRDDAADVRFRVWDNETGDGIPNARVSLDLRKNVDFNTLGAYANTMDELRTDADGILRLEDVPPGEVTFYVRADGYSRENVVSHLQPARLNKEDLGLVRAYPTIRGRVVPAEPIEAWFDNNWNMPADTTPHGDFAWDGYLDPDKLHTVHFKRPGPFQASFVVSDIRVGTNDVLLRFPPTGSLSVTCVDPSGKPVCKVLAAIQVADDTLGGDFIQAPDGEFRFPTLPVGKHALWLARRGYEHLGPVHFEIKANDTTRLKLRFARVLPVLAVRVRDSEGKPVDHCRVDVLTADGKDAVPLLPDELYSTEYWPSHLLHTATDGRCFVPVPVRGRITVGVAWGLDGDTLVPRQVSLPPEGTVHVEFVLDWKLAVKEVSRDSAAGAAGLQPGDVIISWAGETPKRPEDCAAGDATLQVVVRREDRNVSLRLPPRAAGFVIAWKLFAR